MTNWHVGYFSTVAESMRWTNRAKVQKIWFFFIRIVLSFQHGDGRQTGEYVFLCNFFLSHQFVHGARAQPTPRPRHSQEHDSGKYKRLLQCHRRVSPAGEVMSKKFQGFTEIRLGNFRLNVLPASFGTLSADRKTNWQLGNTHVPEVHMSAIEVSEERFTSQLL